MILFTSSYGLAGKFPNTVGISGRAPEGWTGRRMPSLAPKRWIYDEYMKTGNVVQYTLDYSLSVLAQLNRAEVLQELGDGAILLCYEQPWQFCHRKLVGSWLSKEPGVVVRELVCPLV